MKHTVKSLSFQLVLAPAGKHLCAQRDSNAISTQLEASSRCEIDAKVPSCSE
jgi:hypothetical protein